MTRNELFEQIKLISQQVDSLSGIVQNPYLPNEVQPEIFHKHVDECISNIKQWEEKVTEYYRDMTDSQKKEILTER